MAVHPQGSAVRFIQDARPILVGASPTIGGAIVGDAPRSGGATPTIGGDSLRRRQEMPTDPRLESMVRQPVHGY